MTWIERSYGMWDDNGVTKVSKLDLNRYYSLQSKKEIQWKQELGYIIKIIIFLSKFVYRLKLVLASNTI